MVGRVREHTLALACLRHGLPAVEGRGLDRLPAVVTRPFEATLAGGLADVGRAFQAVTELFVGEIEQVDADLARRIGPLLRALVP
ncbi:hypothetical protein H4696_005377 [Amycolatopsis lexingtonensis]|uniref:Uncharacterized protein n=1 Tax=Amycolatopsis lexingtonensis TaxID=218822 RepID=A0ABR9I5P1_9PSEU|nr:hypothetical protein [Amycolatopsis lexingtonensis]MBE1498277.1 hypothetical protein [Amycolatopsis lexingtonensis]